MTCLFVLRVICCTWYFRHAFSFSFFFFNDTATTEIYTLSLHDALPISIVAAPAHATRSATGPGRPRTSPTKWRSARSEEHTSELQSQSNLVCRLLLEKKKNIGPRRLPNPAWFAHRTATRRLCTVIVTAD